MLRSSNDITPAILTMIEEAAQLFFVPKQIALMVEIDETFMMAEMENHSSDIYRAFNKGWLQSEFDQRKGIFQLALSGSSPAQTMVNSILTSASLKLID